LPEERMKQRLDRMRLVNRKKDFYSDSSRSHIG